MWFRLACWKFLSHVNYYINLRIFLTMLNMWSYHIFHFQVYLFIYLFSTPPIKQKQGLQVDGRLLITNHLDHHYDWPKTRNNNKIKFIIFLLQQVLGFIVPFISLSKLCKNVKPKTILMSQINMFWFWFTQF
jgi:hypothetical protein